MVADDHGPLGRTVTYPDAYDPSLLTPIPRTRGRALLGLDERAPLPFSGFDCWTLYEASWLDSTGKPRRLVLEMIVPASSPNLVESKSLKLYLNSLNFYRFASDKDALETIRADISGAIGCEGVELQPRELYRTSDEPSALLQTWWDSQSKQQRFSEEVSDLAACAWQLIDDEDLGELPNSLFDEDPDDALLRTTEGSTDTRSDPQGQPVSEPSMVEKKENEERLVTHLLRTLCPVTGQPDWGSLLVQYSGPPIHRVRTAGICTTSLLYSCV